MPLYIQDLFGDIDAAQDSALFSCFVQLPSHIDSLHPKYRTIRAYKGAGKTAYLKQLQSCSMKVCHLKEKCPFNEPFCKELGSFFIVPIDITEISFKTLYDLTQSKSDPQYEIQSILSNILKAMMINGIVEEIKSGRMNDNESEFIRAIKSKRNGDSVRSIIKGLLSSVDKHFSNDTVLAEIISKTFLEDGKHLDELYTEATEYLKDQATTAILIVDRFDIMFDWVKGHSLSKQFYDHTIATSLLEITLDATLDNRPRFGVANENVQIKVLFPENMYSSITPRDLQKYNSHAIKMRWSPDDIKLFLEKRISHALNRIHTKSGTNENPIQVMFTPKINNNYFKSVELVEDYIIRHSLFKPRDIQQLCTSIVSEYIEKKSIRSEKDLAINLPIDENSIRYGIKKGSQEIIKYLTIEFESINLKGILSAIRNKDNVMAYGDLFNLIANRMKSDADDLDTKDIINILWDIGVVGLLKKGGHEIVETYRNYMVQSSGKNSYYVSLFSFSWDNDTEFKTDDTIVIAPLFFDYLDLKIHPDFMIKAY